MEQRRIVYLEPDEVALEPKWGDVDGLLRLMNDRGVQWRLDPVLQYIVVKKSQDAELLERELGFRDVTESVRRFLERGQGVRVVGCNDFLGMLLYSIADDLLYHVDASSFAVSPVLDMKLVYSFRGLGRAAAYGQRLDFGSVPEAVAAFRDAARKAQRDWVSDHKRPASAGRRTRT